ncbi:MAG TPA: FecR domain-containing protein [Mucilaginibacter sp.]|nr:FecR domain-containing protein [Mucilaginibacter sp.]
MTSGKDNERIQELAAKWRNGTITKEEKSEFNDWYNSFDDTESAYFADETPEILRERMFRSVQIRENLPNRTKIRTLVYFRIVASAAVLLRFSTAAYFLMSKHENMQIVKDIPAGTNKAVLTLANGSKIVLDETADGEVTTQAGITISKAGSGHLVYSVSGTSNDSKPVYNTIETPRGGQYQVILPDGTKIWLNAASSIKFPTIFSGKERNVTLSGEAYFEVAHNKDKPFHVDALGIQIEVLGTHFNVNAYQDEDAVKTTLLEGSVKLMHHQASTLLKPGQQGKVSEGGDRFEVSPVDTSIVTAWKNEMFVFDNTDLHALMRQLSRWYNIEVVYKGQVANDVFFGKIDRKSRLSKVLRILELGDVHFKIEDKKLIVMP